MSDLRSPYTASMAAGEWSEDLYGRSDIERHASSARRLKNMIIRRTGSSTRRPGTVYAGATKTAGVTGRVIPFRRSSSRNYIIEAGNLYFRFWKDHEQILSGGSPYEVTTPYTTADLPAVQFYQSADVMFLTHPSYAPRTLTRTSDAVWTLATIGFTSGPFRDLNDTAVTLTASALTGAGITITASAATFDPLHVGSVWKMKQQNWSAISKWQVATPYGAGDECRAGNRVYTTVAGNTSGLNTPIHTEGIENDGRVGANVDWTYLYSGFGLFQITAYISATQVTATVLSRDGTTQLPLDATAGTTKWQEGALSDYRGWPSSVALYQTRLVLVQGQTLHQSVVDDFTSTNAWAPTNASGDIVADAAFSITIAEDLADACLWVRPFDSALLVGTAGSEWTVGPQNSSNAYGPDNFDIKQHTFVGSPANSRPIRVDDGSTLFVDKSSTRIHLIEANTDATISSDIASEDLSIYGSHLTIDKVKELAFTDEPDSVIWVLLQTGTLAGLTYEKKQQVIAWHQHEIAGTDVTVESICSIPDPTNTYDELWLWVNRTLNGVATSTLEYFGKPVDQLPAQNDRAFLDCSINIVNTVATTSIGGLDHLNGESCMVLADGLVVLAKTPVLGYITLDQAAANVYVGLSFTSEVIPMSPEAGSAIGHSHGKKQRATHAYPRFIKTNHANVSDELGGTIDTVTFPQLYSMSAYPIPLFSGVLRVPVPAGTQDEQEATVRIFTDLCLPFSIASIGWQELIANR